MPLPKLSYVLPKMFAYFKRTEKVFIPDPQSTSGAIGKVDGKRAIDLLVLIKHMMYKHPTGPNWVHFHRRILSMELRKCESMRWIKVREEEAAQWVEDVNK